MAHLRKTKLFVKTLNAFFSKSRFSNVGDVFSKSTKPISVNQNFFDTLYKQLENKPLKS